MAGNGATPEQQALIALQQEMAAVRGQIATVSQAYDQLKAAHDALNLAASTAIGQKTNELTAMEEKLRGLIFRQQFDLLDAKDLKPDAFRGRKTENFKPWAKKFKAYCNSKRTGFRQALE